MSTLLDKAKQSSEQRRSRPYTYEEVELAVAWLKGEIGYSQAGKALKKGKNTVYPFFALALRSGFASGFIKMEMKEKK